jgi:hypothetical protein
MAQRVAYPERIEPPVQLVEETPPERIVARTHEMLAAGTGFRDMLLASTLAVVRSSAPVILTRTGGPSGSESSWDRSTGIQKRRK